MGCSPVKSFATFFLMLSMMGDLPHALMFFATPCGGVMWGMGLVRCGCVCCCFEVACKDRNANLANLERNTVPEVPMADDFHNGLFCSWESSFFRIRAELHGYSVHSSK